MLEGLERVFGALTFHLTESSRDMEAPAFHPRETFRVEFQ
jgi:hypothetical protein